MGVVRATVELNLINLAGGPKLIYSTLTNNIMMTHLARGPKRIG